MIGIYAVISGSRSWGCGILVIAAGSPLELFRVPHKLHLFLRALLRQKSLNLVCLLLRLGCPVVWSIHIRCRLHIRVVEAGKVLGALEDPVTSTYPGHADHATPIQ